MRIAFVTFEFTTEPTFDGGLANYLKRVCIALNQLGHETLVIVPSNIQEKIIQENIEVYRICVSNKWISLFNKITRHKLYEAINWLWNSWKLNKAISLINSEKPIDIIQYSDYTATGFFRVKNIPSIVRISYFLPLWRKAYEERLTLNNKVKEKLEEIALKKADALFCPSTKIANVVEKIVRKKVSIIKTPMFIEVNNFDSRPFNDLLVGKKYLLFFGTIGLLKGALTIADIINKLLSDNPDLFFVFIGKNFSYKANSMMDYIWSKAGPMRGRALYLGRMHHDQLYPIIQNAYAVILPSRVDNMPNTCLEAMALKKIVVGAKNTSMEEIILDGYNGFLSEVDNSFDLLNKIEHILNLDKDMFISLSDNAYKESLKYAPEFLISQLVDYYTNVRKILYSNVK